MFHKLLTTNYSPQTNSLERGSITLVLSAMILIGSLIGSVALSPITNFDTRQQAYEIEGVGDATQQDCPANRCNPGQTSCNSGKYYECKMYSFNCSPSGVWRFASDTCPTTNQETANNNTVTSTPNPTTAPTSKTLTCYNVNDNCRQVTKNEVSIDKTCRQENNNWYANPKTCQNERARRAESSPENQTPPTENTATSNNQSNSANDNCGGSFNNGSEIVLPGKCDYRGSYIASNPNQNLQICVKRGSDSYYSFQTPTPAELTSCKNNLTESSKNLINNKATQNESCGNIAHNSFACSDRQTCVQCINGTKSQVNRWQCPASDLCYQPESPETQVSTVSTQNTEVMCFSTSDGCAEGRPRNISQDGPCESVGQFTDRNQCTIKFKTANANTQRDSGTCYFGVSSCSSISREDLSSSRPSSCPTSSASYCGDVATANPPNQRCTSAIGVTPLNECKGNNLLVCDPNKQIAEVACSSGRSCQGGKCITIPDTTTTNTALEPQYASNKPESNLTLDESDTTTDETTNSENNSCENQGANYAVATNNTCNIICTFPSTISIPDSQATPPTNSFFCTDIASKARRVQCKLFHTQEENNCVSITTPTQIIKDAAGNIGNALGNLTDFFTDEDKDQESQASAPAICNTWFASGLCDLLGLTDEEKENDQLQKTNPCSGGTGDITVREGTIIANAHECQPNNPPLEDYVTFECNDNAYLDIDQCILRPEQSSAPQSSNYCRRTIGTSGIFAYTSQLPYSRPCILEDTQLMATMLNSFPENAQIYECVEGSTPYSFDLGEGRVVDGCHPPGEQCIIIRANQDNNRVPFLCDSINNSHINDSCAQRNAFNYNAKNWSTAKFDSNGSCGEAIYYLLRDYPDPVEASIRARFTCEQENHTPSVYGLCQPNCTGQINVNYFYDNLSNADTSNSYYCTDLETKLTMNQCVAGYTIKNGVCSY